jgi:hypothetical protein
MLSELLLQELRDIISDSKFSYHDFEIENVNYFKVTYKYQPDLSFTIESTYDEKNIISIIPGKIWETERTEVKGSSSIKNTFKEWLDNIWKKIMIDPVHRILEEQKFKVDEILNAIKDFPDEYFTVNEAEELREKLDDLEKNMMENLQNTITDKKELEAEIKSLHNEINTLKTTLTSFKKPKWFQSLGTRIGVWLSDPKNQQSLLQGAVALKKLISKNEG